MVYLSFIGLALWSGKEICLIGFILIGLGGGIDRYYKKHEKS